MMDKTTTNEGRFITIKEVIDICQRNLDKGYLNDAYGDGMYESGYACCLRDIANLMGYDEDNYGVKDKNE